MKTLIIGGTGTISTETTRALLEAGHEVVLFNRARRESPFAGKVRQITGDRGEADTFAARVRDAAPYDCVIDMICFTPQQAHASIAACKGQTGHFIFCSTVDVYAKPPSRYPLTESEAYGPLSTYAERKVACEKLFWAEHEAGTFRVTIIRPSHTYCDRSMLVHALGRRTSWMDRMRCGKPVIIHGDGTSLWTSARAEDVGPVFAAAAGNPATFGKSYHAAAEEWLTWGQYYEKVAAALGGPPPEFVYVPATTLARMFPDRCQRVSENFQYCNIYDNTAAKTDLGYRYTIPFADGARSTVRWLEEHGKIEPWQDDPEYDEILGKLGGMVNG